jgi:hypothetical protein
MNGVEATASDPMLDRLRAQAALEELTASDDPML